MAGVISENTRSRAFEVGLDSSSRTLEFDITGTEDELEVQSLIESQAPAAYQGLTISGVAASTEGGGVWKGYARYSMLDVEYTFDTGGGTAKVTEGYSLINSYTPDGSTAPDFGATIGVTSDSVEGVEIPIPKFDFSETHKFADGDITTAYRKILYQTTGQMNNAPFKGLDTGEAMLASVSGSKRGNDYWTLNFRFSASENATATTPIIVNGMNIQKYGWDHLWYRYTEKADMVGFGLIKRPTAAYVVRVKKLMDFSALNIGIV